jgi:hypothetical protein
VKVRQLNNFFINFRQIRLSAEALLSVGALLYILSGLREARFLGAKMFFENLVKLI